ncbi:MAG TPA: 4Fe-4S dicluster domain-containing protein [Thermoplasmata archaeon]|nr:4Fe-4S dicluster domain-containing protein [Thermoplasmata archaeon]
MEIRAVKEGVFEGKPGFPTQYGPERSDHQPGVPFWPHEVYRDLVIVFLLTAILFFLSAAYTPIVGPPANPAIQPFSVPDWYLLFSWGLLKIADVLPTGVIIDPLGNRIDVSAAFWGDILSIIPVLPIFLLPFLDRGRETRPAKAPFRTAGGMYMLAFVFFSSLYAANDRIIASWPFIQDDALKWMIIIPPVLVGLASYVGIRRLGFRDMYWWLVVSLGGAFLMISLAAAWAFAIGPWGIDGIDPAARLAQAFADPSAWPLMFFGIVAVAYTGVLFYASAALKEKKAKEVVLVATVVTFFSVVGVAKWASTANWGGTFHALQILALYSNYFIALPLFALITFYLGTRTPYSTYEYLLNECYQCGKCHTVCPVTKVEDDALGGLNLVYNTFKKQHDGVPLWTCLACDACSAVCPLDIKYSDYILEERSKVMGPKTAANGGRIAK